MVSYTGPWFCTLSWCLLVLIKVWAMSIAASTALTRLLYIKFNIELYGFGKKRTTALILLMSLANATLFTLIYAPAPSRSSTMVNLCHDESPELVLLKYRLAFRDGKPVQIWCAILYGLAVISLQIGSYVAIFLHLRRHNKTMVAILPDHVLAKRKRKHAIDLLGHMVTFVVEVFATGICLVGYYWLPKIGQFVVMIIVGSNHAFILALVHLTISKILRKELKDGVVYLHEKICSTLANCVTFYHWPKDNVLVIPGPLHTFPTINSRSIQLKPLQEPMS